jgi:hypothetical protein
LKERYKLYAFGAASAIVVFYAVVLVSGLGWNPLGAHWNFTNTGQFGDSFGPLSALMATIAAVSALAAYLAQREELTRVRAENEYERASSARRDFEQTFFNLLKLFRETVSEIDIPNQYGLDAVTGRDALRRVLEEYIRGTQGSAEADSKAFKNAYVRLRDDLAHYFRLFYHILRFIDTSLVEEKMLYVRLLRATLSDAEIVLIGLNCMYGGGSKLKPLVERYRILHNISATSANAWRMCDAFDHTAFGDRTIQEGRMTD